MEATCSECGPTWSRTVWSHEKLGCRRHANVPKHLRSDFTSQTFPNPVTLWFMRNRMGKRPVPLLPFIAIPSQPFPCRKGAQVADSAAPLIFGSSSPEASNASDMQRMGRLQPQPLLLSQIAEVFMQLSRENERPKAASSGWKRTQFAMSMSKILTYTYITHISHRIQMSEIMLNQRSTHPWSLRLADPLTEAESAFLGKVLSFVPVMARTSKLMRPFLDEGDGSLHELAARSLHQVPVNGTVVHVVVGPMSLCLHCILYYVHLCIWI